MAGLGLGRVKTSGRGCGGFSLKRDCIGAAISGVFLLSRALGKPDTRGGGFLSAHCSVKLTYAFNYAPIAATSGLMPMMFMTRVML